MMLEIQTASPRLNTDYSFLHVYEVIDKYQEFDPIYFLKSLVDFISVHRRILNIPPAPILPAWFLSLYYDVMEIHLLFTSSEPTRLAALQASVCGVL